MFTSNELLKKGFTPVYVEETSFAVPPIQTSPGIPQIIVVSGSNYEMGYQFGEQLAPKIHSLVTVANAAVLQWHGKETVVKDMQVQHYFIGKYDPEFRPWLKGIQAGCEAKGYGISYEDLLLAAFLPEACWCRSYDPYPEDAGIPNGEETSEQKTGSNAAHAFCNGFAAAGKATKDGKPVVAVSGSPADEMLDRVILIAFPDHGPSYTTFSTIGKPHCQMGMNSAGFAWVQTSNTNPEDVPWGCFCEILFHYFTQCCTSPEQAQSWLESIPRIGAIGNYTMSDANGNISVAETNYEHFLVRKPGHCQEQGNFVVATNHFEAPETKDFNLLWDGDDTILRESKARYSTVSQYLSEAAQNGGVDIDYIRMMFHSNDWYDPETKQWHYNEPGSNKGYDLFEYSQQSVFFPADLTAYYMQGTSSGLGRPAGCTGELIKVQLADDPMAVAEKMKASSLEYYVSARNQFRKELNANKELQKNYANQVELRKLLDGAFIAYESGVNRAAYAYMAKLQGASNNEHLKLVGEALSHYAKTQSYAQMLTAQLNNLSTESK